MKEKNNYPRLNELVYEAIREKIITGEFAPGFRLKEDFLVNLLKISKTPIKLGIARLEQDGMVYTVPRRGSYVIKMSPEDIREVYLLRVVLEGLAAKLAVKNISKDKLEDLEKIQLQMNANIKTSLRDSYIKDDGRFHNIIIEASENKLLKECLNPILNKIEILKYRSALSIKRRKESCKEHLDIIEAFKEKNKVRTESVIRFHLKKAMEAAVGDITSK